MKSFVRLLTMLAAVIVASDSFAQARTPRSSLLGNRLNRDRSRSLSRAEQPAPAAQTSDGETAERKENTAVPALNWVNASVDEVLSAYADQLNKTYLKDPAVPNAQISLKSREGQQMTQAEYLEAIEVVLEMNGVHLEPYGEKFIRVLPRKDARKEGIPLIMDTETKLRESGRVVSMMIPFKNIGTEEAQKALEGFKSNNGILLVFERTNTILATDTEQNINRMLEIAKAIDTPLPKRLEQVYVRQIKNTTASRIQEILQKIVEESMKEQEEQKKGKGNAANNQPSSNGFGSRLLGGKKNEPAGPVSQASLVMSIKDADRGIIHGKVQILSDDEHSNKLVIIAQPDVMEFFDKIISEIDIETTPDTVVKVYRLKYAEADKVRDMIDELIGASGGSKSSGKDSSNRNAKNGSSGSNISRGTSNTAMNAQRKAANQRTGEAKAGELTKDNTTVIADERINGIVVMTEKQLVPTIEQIIESMDIKLSQVLIETVIIEVQLGDGIETGMDWVQKGRQEVMADAKTATGNPLYYKSRTTTMTNEKTGESKTTTSILSDMVESGYSYNKTSTSGDWTTTITEAASSLAGKTAQISHDGIANYYTAGTATAIGGGQGGQVASEIASGITSNMLGKAFNFIFDSEELGIAGILQATKTDSHSKYIASPVIMTLDNKEATIEATQMKYLFKGYQYSGSTYNGSAVPDYEQKDLGITIKVTPKINPNGTVMLTLEEEYSQEGAGQMVDGVLQATTVTRKMSADALLENNQTVIFAGMTETSLYEKETGIPILKDIPYIGKWLFGTVNNEESRTELLVFMTPYVLDDAEAAQAEAIRRKRAISDQHAWDDHGWSASALADPVSKKEQLRRIKEEWKKQDSEREAKIAIEQEKVRRVKDLERMSKDERESWLKLHKEELDKEAREDLEKKMKDEMLDKEGQEKLNQLAREVRERRLKKADEAIEKNAQKYMAENEHDRLARERAEKEQAAKAEPAVEPAAEPAVEPENSSTNAVEAVEGK